MKTRCSSSMSNDEIVSALRAIRKLAHYSDADGCDVVKVVCGQCDQAFVEELEAARANIIAGRKSLCLACDPDADEYAVVRVIIRFKVRL